MDWNVILGIATIAGTLFGAISIYDASKSKKELQKYTYLFDLAEQNIDKKLTLEEINRLHEEKQAMDKIIKEEIPRQARLTVLYDRLKADEEYLSSSYNRYKQTQKEYEKLQLEEQIEIPKNILDEIEHQILPDYLIKEQRQKYMFMLTIISYTTAFLAIVPIFNIFSRYSILATAYPLLRIIGLNMPKERQERKRYIFNLFYTVALIILFLTSVCTGYMHYTYWRTSIDTELIFVFSTPLFILLLIPKLLKFFKNIIKKKK